jgi:hypothetical protein
MIRSIAYALAGALLATRWRMGLLTVRSVRPRCYVRCSLPCDPPVEGHQLFGVASLSGRGCAGGEYSFSHSSRLNCAGASIT